MRITPADYLPFARSFEGAIPYLYLDTAGIVTVGIGHALETAGEAAVLPFVLGAGGARATTAEIEADYAAVKALPKGRVAAFYRPFSRTVLGDDAIADLFTTDLNDFLAELGRKVAGFDELPRGAQLALLDMAYNLGVRGLLEGFPRMMNCLARHDWSGCARESRRPQLSAARNQQVADWLQGAAAKENPNA